AVQAVGLDAEAPRAVLAQAVVGVGAPLAVGAGAARGSAAVDVGLGPVPEAVPAGGRHAHLVAEPPVSRPQVDHLGAAGELVGVGAQVDALVLVAAVAVAVAGLQAEAALEAGPAPVDGDPAVGGDVAGGVEEGVEGDADGVRALVRLAVEDGAVPP